MEVLSHVMVKKTDITISTGVALQQSLLALKITYSNWKIQGRTESATIYYAGKKFITLSCNLQTNE